MAMPEKACWQMDNAHTYIQEVFLKDSMHDNAYERVEKYRAGIFPASFVKKRLSFRRFSRRLDSTNIMVQTDEQTRDGACWLQKYTPDSTNHS